MSETTTAKVETLAAEVRVLMVGNRQVTLSVAKQLDAFDFGYDDEVFDFTPFGRIRTGAKGETYVSCSRSAKGAQFVRKADGSYKYRREVVREYDFEWIGRHNSSGSLVVVHAFRVDATTDWDLESYNQWRELPLIVLAGLR